MKSISSGFIELDQLIGGIYPKRLVCISSESRKELTSFLSNFSMKSDVRDKILYFTDIDAYLIKEEMDKYSSENEIEIIDDVDIKDFDIFKEIVDDKNPKIVILDLLIDTSTNGIVLTRKLKMLAIKKEITVFFVRKISKKREEKYHHIIPSISNIGSVEADCDDIISISNKDKWVFTIIKHRLP